MAAPVSFPPYRGSNWRTGAKAGAKQLAQTERLSHAERWLQVGRLRKRKMENVKVSDANW